MSSAYAFRPMSPEDLPMLRGWLETPEARRWWGDPDAQQALLETDLPDPAMRMWIVSLDGRPFAYVQDYDPRSWGLTEFDDLPPGSRGTDQFIGVPEMIGWGHGSALLRLHIGRLLLEEGAPAVFTDPDPENGRAIAAYGKAGFRALGLREMSDGVGLLMVRYQDEA